MLLEAILLSVIAASTPLLLAASGELVVERAGVLNLGVEGMMIIGAACGFAGAWLTGSIFIGALFMLQNALQAGSLIAVQPPLTLGDALISACYGVTVFGENVQTSGWLLVVEIVAVLAIAAGCIELSRSLALVHAAEQPEPAG